MYKKRNSFDGCFCLFDSVAFKKIFDNYLDKTGWTKKQLLDDLSEKIGISEHTIAGWLRGKTPVDGIISENGKINKSAIVVRIAEYFKQDCKKLLKFKKNVKELKIMENIKEVETNKKYNNIQAQTLKHLYDVVIEYLIAKCHIMDKYVTERNYMEYFNYSKILNKNFNTQESALNNKEFYDQFYKRPTKEEVIKMLENDVKKYKESLNNCNNDCLKSLLKSSISDAERNLLNIDEYMDDYIKMDKEQFCYRFRYNIYDDDEYAFYVDQRTIGNSEYGYVLFEIEKASDLLREEFINYLKELIDYVYDIYESDSFTYEELKEKYFQGVEDITQEQIDSFDPISTIKELFREEINNYC